MSSTAVKEIPARRHTAEDHQRMVEENLGLVHHVARQLYRTYAMQAEFDELLSAGTIGLIGAVQAFDTSKNVAFSTFAAPRIRGAIQDELRRVDELPRSLRRKTKELANAREALTRRLGRRPTSREMAEHLEIDLETLWRWEAEGESGSRVSFSEPAEEGEGQRVSLADTLAGELPEAMEDRLNTTQELELLKEALLNLKQQERAVLSLYYFEELKLREIAEVLELTESRISQIRTKALANLRADLGSLRAAAA